MLSGVTKWDQTGVSIDIPDATKKGGTSKSYNAVYKLLWQERNINVLTFHVLERFQEALHDCFTGSCLITKLCNSTYKVNADVRKGAADIIQQKWMIVDLTDAQDPAFKADYK